MAKDQETFFDNQNYTIDIDKIYDDFIKEIDEIRSHSNSTTLDIALDYANSGVRISENSTPQESRCHAFYRLIGLPVVGPNSSYSPGFNRDENKQKLLDNKKSVSKSMDDEIIKFLNFRELDNSATNNIFALQDVQASVLALSSINIRKFADPLSTTDTTDPFSTIDPVYTPIERDLSIADLSEYVDGNGKQIDQGSIALSYARTRRHRLKPFIVHPTIELTVRPSKNIISAPFVFDKSALLISNDIYTRRPFIEFVCRARFDGTNKLDKLTDSQEATINFIETSDSFRDSEVIQKLSQSLATVTEQAQFADLFNIMRAMINELIDAKEIINKVRDKYLWVPVPNVKGPEYGSVTRNIVLNDPNLTIYDLDMAEKTIKKRFNEITRNVLTDNKKDLGNFAFGNIQISPNNSTGLGNNNSDNLDELLAAREEECTLANTALRQIEIIMGEFSGLGFCDIIAIYGALWLVNKEDLVGLLDNNARDRMKLVPELKEDPALNSPTDTRTALVNFEKKVKELFELMDKIYDDASENNDNVYTTQ